MSDREVWKEAYEVVGAGIPLAEAFYAEHKEQSRLLWAAVEAFGASGYRPSHDGGIRNLLFKEVPSNFRVVGKNEKYFECVPHKGRAGGKELAERIAELPRVTPEHRLSDLFGWGGRSPLDGYNIYYAAASKLELPSVRYLLRLPRQLDDGWAAPDTLKLIPMSEYIRAFEVHNAEVAKLKVAA